MRRLLPLVVALAFPAQAQTPDDRLYGHFPYPEAAAEALTAAPAGFGIGQPCRVASAMLPDLTSLLAAADSAGLGQQLRGLSCFRSIARQGSLFCPHGRSCADVAARAREIGPPGHSEHATGYAIDFAARPQLRCRDVDPCFADTQAGRWLLANGPRFGFELSFPAGNAQGVAWEPWHWRWAGVSQDEPGAAAARALFARARGDYPAAPAAIGFAVRMIGQPDPPQPLSRAATSATRRP